jgi:prepilin-type N-terminal cleavage/methylation domain-containing protein
MAIIKNTKKGFTFVELMVTMGIASIVLAGIYAAYSAQVRSHSTQQAVLDIQQNLRSAVYYLQRSVRMAGYDAGAGAGFVDNFDLFLDPYKSAGASRTGTSICFTVDEDEDGCIDGYPDPTATCAAPNIDNVDNELIAFRLDGNNTLQQYRPSLNSWIPISDNIQAISFRYLDEDLQSVPPPSLRDIRSVEMTITAQPVEELTRTAAKKPQSLTVQIRCRNLRDDKFLLIQ